MGLTAVEPGTVLVDRYSVEDLLAEDGECRVWRARDQILARYVVVHVVPTASPYAERMLNAAKESAKVADPRVLQVLDATDDGEHAVVVREWADGQSLDVILGDGPLPARRAAWIVREVAAAMATAHTYGIPHRWLAPDTVIVTKSSGIKVIGLGTYGALRNHDRAVALNETDEEAQLEDARGLGSLLYACLTARWPGDAIRGLPPAPLAHGQLLRPRQVRAGVPRRLDEICDRSLNDQPRQRSPLVTPDQVRDALTAMLADERVTTSTGLDPVPVLGPVPTPAEAPSVLRREDEPPPPEESDTGEQPVAVPRSRWRRGFAILTALLLAAAVVLTGALVVRSVTADRAAPPTEPAGARADATPRPLKVVRAFDYDPEALGGSGDENADEVTYAFDGDASTSWRTVQYYTNAQFSGLKPGVGLIADLGSTRRVRQVTVRVPPGVRGTNLQVRVAAPRQTSARAPLPRFTRVGAVTNATGTTVVRLSHPTSTRYVLVWLTNLPVDPEGGYRGQISEIEVAG